MVVKKEVEKMKKCTNCQAENPDDALYCHLCGKELVKTTSNQPSIQVNTSNKHVLKKLLLLCIGMAVAVLVFLWMNPEMLNSNKEPINVTQFYDESQVRNAIRNYYEAVETNDYESISKAYADHVLRHHNANNLSNYEVVEKHKNYDSMFGVYGKHISVRWNTLHVDRISDNEISVVFIEDYSIDREDKTKYSKFVLEQHIILNADYKIISIYDVQLQKER